MQDRQSAGNTGKVRSLYRGECRLPTRPQGRAAGAEGAEPMSAEAASVLRAEQPSSLVCNAANRMSGAAPRADPQPRTCPAPRAHFAGDLQRSTKRTRADTRPQRADVTALHEELGCRRGHERPHGATLRASPLRVTAGNMPSPSHDGLMAGGSTTVAPDHRGGREHGMAPE